MSEETKSDSGDTTSPKAVSDPDSEWHRKLLEELEDARELLKTTLSARGIDKDPIFERECAKEPEGPLTEDERAAWRSKARAELREEIGLVRQKLRDLRPADPFAGSCRPGTIRGQTVEQYERTRRMREEGERDYQRMKEEFDKQKEEFLKQETDDKKQQGDKTAE